MNLNKSQNNFNELLSFALNKLQDNFDELLDIADALCDQIRDTPSGCDACWLWNWNPHYHIYYDEITPTGIEKKVLTYDTYEECEAINLFNEDTLELNVRITNTELDDSDCGCAFRDFKEKLDKS